MGLVRQTQNMVATIAADETESGSLYLGDYAWGGLQFPSQFTGSGVTPMVSLDNVHFSALRDAAGELLPAIPFAANRAIPLPDEVFYHPYLLLKSDASEAVVRNILVFVKG